MDETLAIGTHSLVIFTGNLRWHDGELEQERAFQNYEDGKLIGSHKDWVQVPTSTDPKQEKLKMKNVSGISKTIAEVPEGWDAIASENSKNMKSARMDLRKVIEDLADEIASTALSKDMAADIIITRISRAGFMIVEKGTEDLPTFREMRGILKATET